MARVRVAETLRVRGWKAEKKVKERGRNNTRPSTMPAKQITERPEGGVGGAQANNIRHSGGSSSGTRDEYNVRDQQEVARASVGRTV